MPTSNLFKIVASILIVATSGTAQAAGILKDATLTVQCDRGRNEEVRWDSGAGGFRFDSKKDCPALRPEVIDTAAWARWSDGVRAHSDRLGNSPIDIQVIVSDFNVAAEANWNDFAECFEGKSNPENAARDAYTTGKGVPKSCQKQYQSVLALKERWREFLSTSPTVDSQEWEKSLERWRYELKTAPAYHPFLVQTMIEFVTTHRVYYKLDQGKSPSENKKNRDGFKLGYLLALGSFLSLGGKGGGLESLAMPVLGMLVGSAIEIKHEDLAKDHFPRFDNKKYSVNLYFNSVALLANRSTSSCKDFGFWPMAAGGVLQAIQVSHKTLRESGYSGFYLYQSDINDETDSLTANWTSACSPRNGSESQSVKQLFGHQRLWHSIIKAFRALGER